MDKLIIDCINAMSARAEYKTGVNIIDSLYDLAEELSFEDDDYIMDALWEHTDNFIEFMRSK